jgi:PAS domain S-box-containing protein
MAFDFAELQYAIATAAELYYVLHEDGVFEFINQAGVDFFEYLLLEAGRPVPSSLIGINSRELDLPLDWLAIHERGRHMALKTGRSIVCEAQVAIASETHHYEFTFAPLSRPDAAQCHVLVVGREVTRYCQGTQDRHLSTLVGIQQSLMSNPQISRQYSSILQRLGEVSGADRVYLMQVQSNPQQNPLFSHAAEWCAADIPPELDQPLWQSIPFMEIFPSFAQNLKSGKPVSMLTEEVSPPEQKLLKNASIKAVLMLPLMVNQSMWGFIGFDNCRQSRAWSSAEVALLQMAAFLISTRLQQLQSEQAQRQWLYELAQSSRQLQALFRAFPDMVFRLDQNGTYLEWHVQDPSDLYVPPHELPGRRVQDVLPPPLGAELYQRIQEALAQESVTRCEYTLNVPNGEQHFEARIAPVSARQVLAIVRNISDRKRAEQALHSLVEGTASVGGEAFFRALVEHLAIALEVRYVVVQELLGDRARVLAIWDNDHLAEPFEHFLENTPCDQTRTQGLYCCSDHLQDRFPEDDLLRELGAVSYAGVVLTDAQESPIGMLCVLDTKPFSFDATTESVFKIFAARTSMELQRQRAELALHQQAMREQAMRRVIQSIRMSLDLNVTFATAVTEMGNLLAAQRVGIFEYVPKENLWRVIAASGKDPSAASWVGTEYSDRHNALADRLKQFEIIRHDDVQAYTQEQVDQGANCIPSQESWLILPLSNGENLWGSLAMVRNPQMPWLEPEVAIAQTVVDQLAIAIQQAELYHQVQQLNASLETQVLDRTIQLQRALDFEDLVRRITARVRDSLDEPTILQATVAELASELGVILANIGLYEKRSRQGNLIEVTIQGEYGSPTAIDGPLLSTQEYPELYHQLLQGIPVQLCTAVAEIPEPWVTVFLCPISDEQGVIGDLLLLRNADFHFSLREMQLVEQVANQCAIAIRQSWLYQATQAQVTELEELNRIKDDFLSTVSHELRTPITNIKMASQLLELVIAQLQLDDARLDRYMAILRQECNQEIELINDLLDLQQLEAGMRSLNFIEVNLKRWLPRVVQPFLERIQEGDRRLVLTVPDTVPVLTTDVASLQRILVELLNNACLYTPPGETISVAVEAIPGKQPSVVPIPSQGNGSATLASSAPQTILLLSISSTGGGISPEDKPRVFEPFYRKIGIDRWRHRGTGLGLALVKRLTEHIGGTVELQCDEQHTCFLIELPVMPTIAGGRSLLGDRLQDDHRLPDPEPQSESSDLLQPETSGAIAIDAPMDNSDPDPSSGSDPNADLEPSDPDASTPQSPVLDNPSAPFRSSS